jgi:cyclopropane fatty-acyl-phospholipid synthase-like methyltransferase
MVKDKPARIYFNPRYNVPVQFKEMNQLLNAVNVHPDDLVLDVGCGNGELLRHLASQHKIKGFGVDPRAPILDYAVNSIDQSTLTGRIQFIGSTIQNCHSIPKQFHHLICMGSTHAFGEPGSTLINTLNACSKRLFPGGNALIGEGLWTRSPKQQYLELTGSKEDHFFSLERTLEIIEGHGFNILAKHVSDLVEWDDFEGGFLQAAKDEARDCPDSDTVQKELVRRKEWYQNYRRWGRSTLGFLSIVIEKPH